jgi:hypothetical protein
MQFLIQRREIVISPERDHLTLHGYGRSLMHSLLHGFYDALASPIVRVCGLRRSADDVRAATPISADVVSGAGLAAAIAQGRLAFGLSHVSLQP